MFKECRIHLIQPELGYQVGQKTGTEKHVVVRLTNAKPTMVIANGGHAMAEYDLFLTEAATFSGLYNVEYNSFNPNHNYDIGNPSSDAGSRIWLYEPRQVELHISYWTNDNGVPRVEHAVNLRNAIMTSRGFHPAGGPQLTGSGFVRRPSPILHAGPVGWTVA